MSDVDDDLLLLAGGSSSDEEEDDAETNKDSSFGSKMNSKASAKKGGARKGGRSKNDSEEEGEASSGHSSPESLRSAPMSESDSDSDGPSPLDTSEMYPLEGKFLNTTDRAEILALPEIKREEILAERASEVEKDRQNRTLRQLLKNRETEKKQDKKRKAGAADLEEGQRKTSRQRTKLGGGKVGEPTTGIDSLKRARAEKSDRQRRRDEDKDKNRDYRSRRDSYSPEHDDGGDSEVEWDDGKSKTRKRSPSPDYRDAEPASLPDIERVRVGRTRFAQVCFYPGFEEAITGCFVRISVGIDKETGQNIYRMATIKGFATDRPYAITSENGKQFKTTQYIKAAHGKSERNWPFITCSDSPFTESEWNRYKVTCHNEGISIPTKPKHIQKCAEISALINRSWTEAELQEKLTKSGALIDKFLPLERLRINGLIKDATAAGDDKEVETLKEELSALDGPKLAYNTSMQVAPVKSASGGLSQQERLAQKNLENRQKNKQDVRQAQINERRAIKMNQAAIARGEAVVEDTSRRLKTKAKFKHDVAEVVPGSSGTNTPTVGTPSSSAKKNTTPLPYLPKLQKKGMPTISRPVMDDDIIGALDLDIDIDI